jgi:hypothetical protein
MTPEERQMLADLFDRVRSQAGGPRDPQAEAFIADAVRSQPYAPYLLAQAVLVQQQALEAASAQIKGLQDQVQSLSSASQTAPASGSFLGNLGKSLFGGSSPQSRGAVPNYSPPPSYNPPPSYAPPPGQNPWGQQQANPWGQQPPAPPASGGFLKGALGAAAGVAGGVLLADGLRSMFAGHNNSFTQLAGIDTTPGSGAGGGSDADQSNLQGQDQDAATDQEFARDIDNDPNYSSNDDSFDSNDDNNFDTSSDDSFNV